MAKNRKARRAAAKNPVAAPDTPPPPLVPSDARSWIRLGLIAAVSVGLLAWFYVAITNPAAPPATGGLPGQVWDPVHGHYHTVTGGELPASQDPTSGGLPGQVWSEEHGHWHDPADEE